MSKKFQRVVRGKDRIEAVQFDGTVSGELVDLTLKAESVNRPRLRDYELHVIHTRSGRRLIIFDNTDGDVEYLAEGEWVVLEEGCGYLYSVFNEDIRDGYEEVSE